MRFLITSTRIVHVRRSRDAGFSLLEMMTALAITLIVVAGVLASFAAQSRVELVQDTIAEDQSNLRAGMELLKRDIRNTGYMVGAAGVLPFVAGNNTGANGTDQIQLNAPGLGTGFIFYGVQNVGTVPTLIRSTDPTMQVGNILSVIPNVDDFQLAYGWDADGNNVIDPGEWMNNPAGNQANVTAIRINLLVRAAKADSTRSNYRRPAIEDRAAAGATDSYPRRLLTTIVQIRNQGL
jgi:prepilin-type N-terminal cleavage/methylation domain-containing protein